MEQQQSAPSRVLWKPTSTFLLLWTFTIYQSIHTFFVFSTWFQGGYGISQERSFISKHVSFANASTVCALTNQKYILVPYPRNGLQVEQISNGSILVLSPSYNARKRSDCNKSMYRQVLELANKWFSVRWYSFMNTQMVLKQDDDYWFNVVINDSTKQQMI